MYDLIGETDRKGRKKCSIKLEQESISLFITGDRDPKHRAEEIIRICDVTGNKKLTKEEVNRTK